MEADRDLAAKLKAEWPGILRWLVQGCLDWQRDGLDVPDEVRGATAEYRKEADRVGSFIEQCCVVNFHARVGASDLFKAYLDFSGDTDMTQTRFGKAMAERGYHSDRITAGPQRGRNAWFGIGLLSTEEPSEQFE